MAQALFAGMVMRRRARRERRSAAHTDSTPLRMAHWKAIDFHVMNPIFAPPESPSAGRLLLGRGESDRGLAAALDLDGEPRGNIAFQPTDSSAADPDGRGKPIGLDVVVDGRARKPGAGLYGFAAEYRKGLISHVSLASVEGEAPRPPPERGPMIRC